MASFVRNAYDVIRSRNRIIYIAITVLYILSFVTGMLIGFAVPYLPAESSEEMYSFMDQTTENYMPVIEAVQEGPFFSSLIIFGNNFFISLIIFITGILLIPSFLMLIAQGAVIGMFFGLTIASDIPFNTNLAVLIFVFISEATALILASAEGFYLFLSLFPKSSPRKKIRRHMFISNFKKSMNVMLLIGLILLVSAFIEVISIRVVLEDYTECGVAFSSLMQDSPASAANLSGVIIGIDNKDIITLDNLTDILNNKSPGEIMHVTTTSGNYTIEFGNETTLIGIVNIRTSVVKKDECSIYNTLKSYDQ